ncbi:MAG: phospho-sugar mutase [Deltaproteobacteria bacterium]|nr:phospho-sugar mutase [Deltaproteobacteria bacterium]
MQRDALITKVRSFIEDDPDPTSRAELEALLARGADDELAERFRGPLEFGTAGLRGVLGAGESRMNRAVIIKTTAGLARYLLDTVPDVATRGVVLGRDARRGSVEFLEEAAAVLAGAGIPAHVFERDGESTIVPTPFVSYAVRVLDAAAGVMITASHNPPEYNGYKVYAANSAQIVPPMDAGIAGAIEAVQSVRAVPRPSRDEARARGLRRAVDRAVIDGYYDEIAKRSRRSEGRDAVTIVYTPMHGVGDEYAHELLAKLGFTRVESVPEQAEPDGSFPTVRFPNPEEPGALSLATALARARGADVVIANDPDADRLAMAVPDGHGGFVQLDGNQVGVLLGHYLLADDPRPAKERLAITTIVSSPLLGMICQKLGVRYGETLTGFKWITNKAMEVEAATGATFVFGYEEALGYTIDAVVRDKDGISAAARVAELVASLKVRGQTVLGRLEAIYRQFGLVVSKQHNVTRPGTEGAARIKREMAAMRAAPPRVIGDEKVIAVRDYLSRVRTSFGDDATDPLDLPPSDVLSFELEGGSRVTMRPSGTEPKIKYYLDVVEPLGAKEPFETGRARALSRLDRLEKAFVTLTAAIA